MERRNKRAKMVQDIPDDLILDIFSRLPDKSLYRFRCVCKLWSDLICPHINNKHQKLFLLFKDHCSILDCYEATSDSDANEAVVTVEYQFNESLMPSLLASAEILTSCDSLLLLSLSDNESGKLLLFDPFSGYYKVFPRYSSPSITYSQHFGICYDYSDDDYKVVCVGSRGFKPFFTVFSFKNNSWKCTEFLPNWISSLYLQGVSVNGAPHWVFYRSNRPHFLGVHAVLRFDLRDGFKEVLKPPEEFVGHYFSLASLRGNLCAYGYFLSSFVVAEMKQCGVKESWTQVCRIRMNGCCMKPLAFTKKGEIVIAADKEELFINNVEDDSFKTLLRFVEQLKDLRLMATYANSSISLGSDCRRNRGNILSIKHCEDH